LIRNDKKPEKIAPKNTAIAIISGSDMVKLLFFPLKYFIKIFAVKNPVRANAVILTSLKTRGFISKPFNKKVNFFLAAAIRIKFKGSF